MDAMIHQGMGGVEHPLDGVEAVAFLAPGNVTLGKVEIVENALCVGPLLEQIIILKEMVVAKPGMGEDQRLHGHGVFFHDINDAWTGVDDDLIGKAAQTAPVKHLVTGEVFAERPVFVHQRHADRRIGVEHLLRCDHFDLTWVGVESEVAHRNRLNGIMGALDFVIVPVGAFEQQIAHWWSLLRHSHFRMERLHPPNKRWCPCRCLASPLKCFRRPPQGRGGRLITGPEGTGRISVVGGHGRQMLDAAD